MFIITFLFVWTICSIWYFIKNLGRKHGPETTIEKILDVILCPPAFAIAAMFGLYTYLKRLCVKYH